MATSIQILLPLICAVLVEGQIPFQDPFFQIPGLQHLVRPDQNVAINGQALDQNVNKFSQEVRPHGMGSHHSSMSSNSYSYNTQHRGDPFDPYNSYLNGGVDPYFGIGPFGRPNFDPMPGMNYPMPGIHNIFNIPGLNYKVHPHPKPTNQDKPTNNVKIVNNGKDDDKNPKEPKPDQPAAQDKDLKSATEPSKPEKVHIPEDMPPKTNKVSNDEMPKDKNDKNVDLNKKKDYLLVGSGNNGNNVFLLHENNPIPNTVVVPNNNQPGKNVVYVPYNPGQANNQVYQIVNGQVVSTPNNQQVTSNKISVNTAVTNPTTSNNNMNNPGYILVYFNGQMIQIPGVILNPPQNNVQNGNPTQGTNVVTAIPNNVPVVQNPGTNNIYTAVPNTGSNPIVFQMPMTMVANPGNQAINLAGNQPNPNIVQQPTMVVTNPAPNGYYLSNMAVQPSQGSFPNQGNGQNIQYQPAVAVPVNSGSNGYAQPNMVVNQNQGPSVPAPSQGAVATDPNLSIHPAVAFPVDSGSNGYNQPMAQNQGNQGLNSVVNTPNHDTAVTPENKQPNDGSSTSDNNALVLDGNNLSDYGAIPAVMVADFKDEAQSSKDKKKEKNKKDKNKKKDKKNKDEVKKNDA